MVNGGDFNNITRTDKKIGGKVVNQNRARKIITSLNHCKLLDQGFKGSNLHGQIIEKK